MKRTNIGVQLYPIVLLLAAFGFYVLNAKGLFWTCLIASGILWSAIFSESSSFDREP